MSIYLEGSEESAWRGLARMCVHSIIKYSVGIKIRTTRLEIQLKSFFLFSLIRGRIRCRNGKLLSKFPRKSFMISSLVQPNHYSIHKCYLDGRRQRPTWLFSVPMTKSTTFIRNFHSWPNYHQLCALQGIRDEAEIFHKLKVRKNPKSKSLGYIEIMLWIFCRQDAVFLVVTEYFPQQPEWKYVSVCVAVQSDVRDESNVEEYSFSPCSLCMLFT